MDSMDIDQVVYIPDTPDRASRPNRNAGVCIKESISSLSGHLRDTDICDEELRNLQSVKTELIIENRGKSLLFRPVNNLSGSDNFECCTNSIWNSNSASSCTSAVSDRTTNHQNDISFHSQLMGKRKAPSNYESFACNEGGSDVDLTEDQKTAQNVAYRLNRNTVVCVDKEINSSLSGNLTNGDICDVELRNQKSQKPKLIIANRGRRVLMHSVENLSVFDNSECQTYAVRNSSSSNKATRNSSASNNAPSGTRMISDRATNHENDLSFHGQLIGKGKAPSTSELFACDDSGTVVHLTEDGKTFQNGTSRTWHLEPKKESICSNGFSSMHHIANTSKGKEKVDNRGSVGSSVGQLKELHLPVVDQYEGGKTVSNTLPATASSRVVGQRRLVRNGCISPHNIAKAKQLAEKHDNESSSVLQNNMETVTPSVQSDLFNLRDLVAEESSIDRVKGKGLINYSYSSKEPNTKILDLPSRTSKNSNGSGDAHKHSEELVGWRSTHNNVEKSNFLLYDEEWHPSRRKDGALFGDHQHANRAVGRVRGSGITVSNDHSEDQDLLSREIVRPVTRNKSRLGQSGEHQHLANALHKRQKHESALRNGGECSSSADSEIVFLGSPGEPSNLRSARTQNHSVMGILNPVIEIDDSPEIRQNSSHSLGSSSNDTQDVRERQVEADELLARELQEQLYNEMPGVGIAEIDAQLALTLQQQDSQHGFSGGGLSTPYSHTRGPLRYSQSSSTQVRVPTTRMARLRNRLGGMPRTLLSRPRDSLFPPNMDTDMRIRMLEALEAASDMGMLNNMLQVDRDFNENDYEMLLALDENNHQVGVSVDRINSLPESKVQSDNFEEDCAICLETPTIGDTIRHLPCLHKFHKDCVDTWLGRKTSCPVCKSSIT